MKQYKLSPPKISLRSVFAAAAPSKPDPAPLPSIPEPTTAPPAEKKRRPPVLSLRLSAEERDRLERDAAGMSISAYVRLRLFGDNVKPRKTRGKFPVKDHQALSRVLGRLGRSNLHTDLHRLLLAVEEGRVEFDGDLEQELRDSCAAISAMRDDLIRALGQRPL